MLKKLKNISENKILKTIGNIIYILLFIIIVLMLVIVITQRITNNNITIGGIRIFSVATGSMVPVYNVGDVLVAKEIEPDKIKVGDDVVYQGEKGSYSGKVITHRVISIEQNEDNKYTIVTQGVANEQEDPEISEEQVYGKVIYKIHILSFLTKLTKNVYAFYFVIFIPAAIIGYRTVRNIFNNEDEEEGTDGKDSKNNKKDSD